MTIVLWDQFGLMAAARRVAALSRGLGLGDGSIIGGRVTLALDSGALRTLAAGRHVVVVTGTNGKTTTSHMAAELGVRLAYAEVPHLTEADPLAAFALLPDGKIDVVANYTAFLGLSRRLRRAD